jgi:hypothetical protein
VNAVMKLQVPKIRRAGYSRLFLSSHAQVHRFKKIIIKKIFLVNGEFFGVESFEHAIKLRVPKPMGPLLASLKILSF